MGAAEPTDSAAGFGPPLVALADPAIQKRLADMGTELFPAAERSPAAHAQYLAKDLARAREVVKAGNIQLD